jgi:hypothetical protein
MCPRGGRNHCVGNLINYGFWRLAGRQRWSQASPIPIRNFQFENATRGAGGLAGEFGGDEAGGHFGGGQAELDGSLPPGAGRLTVI